MPGITLLAVDSDRAVLEGVGRVAARSGYAFLSASEGTEAVRLARSARPDAVLARLGFARARGAELVTLLRQATGSGTPILLTAERGREEEAAEAVDLGAVNVLFFPFTEGELAARLGALLRWARRPGDEGVLNVGPVTVDLERGELLRPQAQPLTASELAILRALLSAPGRRLTKAESPSADGRAMDVHVAALRSKLGAAGRCIETLRGVGYRFML